MVLVNNMTDRDTSSPAVLVTGVAGNLGERLLPKLAAFRVIGVDIRELKGKSTASLAEFHSIDLGRESSFHELLQLIRDTRPSAVIHLAFVLDQVRSGIYDLDRMWRINVAGTARVMEAIAVVNRQARGGSVVRRFVFPSSVSAYGPELTGRVKEDCPLGARTLPYAIQKREADMVVQDRAPELGDCHTYLLRPHIFVGPTVQNYILSALRGTPDGAGRRARKWRESGKKLPILLPGGRRYLENQIQFVHVDDMARLIAYIVQQRDRAEGEGSRLNILNVADRGEPVTVQECAQIARTPISQVPTRLLCRALLRLSWMLRHSSFPPEAFPYLTGSQTTDTTRLREFLGTHYEQVMRFTSEEALRDTFASVASEPEDATAAALVGNPE